MVIDPRHAWTLLAREPGDLRFDRSAPGLAPGNMLPVRIGEADEVVADDARSGEVRPGHSSCEVCEQCHGVQTRGGGADEAVMAEPCCAWTAGAERNASLQSPGLVKAGRTQGRDAVSPAQARIREAVERNPQEKLTTLLHHINLDSLRAAFFRLKKNAAVGVDEVTWRDYARDLDRNLTDLAARVHSGAFRALPSRRVYIPKADGKLRPLGIAAIEDKIVQMALVAILTPIYEAEFLGLSYGFRRRGEARLRHDGVASMTRWMRSPSASRHATSTGFSTPISRRSSTRSATTGWSSSSNIASATGGSSA